MYQAGDYVRCSVIKMTPEKNRISLSMKQSRFTEEERAQAAKAAAEDEGEDAAEAESDLTTDEISTLKKLLEEEDVPPPADSKASGVAVGDADENAEEVADGEKRPEMTEGDLDALVADGDEDEEVEGIEATEPVEAISAEASQAKKPKKEVCTSRRCNYLLLTLLL